MGLFSVNDPKVARLQYHYTSKDVKASRERYSLVDENSIYRVALIAKLITTYAGKILHSDGDWNRPLSDAIPKLKQVLENSNNTDPTWRVQWNKITPWTLATQLSGIPTVSLFQIKERSQPEAEPHPNTTFATNNSSGRTAASRTVSQAQFKCGRSTTSGL